MILDIVKEKQLLSFNSLSLNSIAEFYCVTRSSDDIQEAIDFAQLRNLNITVLGQGTNVVLNKSIGGLVIKPEIRGMKHELIGEEVLIEISASEDWSALVEKSIQNNWFGLENLALIPGTVGAAPIQNIGAYGVELSEFFVSLKAIKRQTGELICINRDECEFGYRDSIFKNRFREKFVITEVALKLSSQAKMNFEYPTLNKALRQLLGESLDDNISPRLIKETVKKIRKEKLPDPKKLANVGSFFKNPEVNGDVLNTLLNKDEKMPHFETPSGLKKIPAAWLIDRCGFRGFRCGGASVHLNHALVLVNQGNGTYRDLMKISDQIKHTVHDRFGITLNIEPTIYGHD